MALVPEANSVAYAAAQKSVYEAIPKAISEALNSLDAASQAAAIRDLAIAFRAVTGGPQ